MKRLVSSAYNLTVLKGNSLPISFTYIRKSSSHSIELVEPHMLLLVEKKKYFVRKHIAACYLSNPGSNQTLFLVCHNYSTFWAKFCDLLYRRLFVDRHSTPLSQLSKCSQLLLTTSIKAKPDEWNLRNPNWYSQSMLLEDKKLYNLVWTIFFRVACQKC